MAACSTRMSIQYVNDKSTLTAMPPNLQTFSKLLYSTPAFCLQDVEAEAFYVCK
jgi:hypothetical protein